VYNIANCSESAVERATFVVRSFDVTPHDPVSIPGNLTFQFDVNILQTLSALTVSCAHIELSLLLRNYNVFIHMITA
jgi:hypothetical protein